MLGARGTGKQGDNRLMGTEFQFEMIKIVLEVNSGHSHTTLSVHLMPISYALEMVNFMLCVFYHNKKKFKETLRCKSN